jgi:hypothetical protein
MFLEAVNKLLFSNMNNINKEQILVTLISLFWKNKEAYETTVLFVCVSVCVCLCILVFVDLILYPP